MPTEAEKFDAAFINARDRGAKTFTYKDKKYSTETAKEKVTKRFEEGGYDKNYTNRDAIRYAKYVMGTQDTPSGSGFSRGANLRANALKQLVAEGKIDASGKALKKGGKIRGYGLARGGKVCKMR